MAAKVAEKDAKLQKKDAASQSDRTAASRGRARDAVRHAIRAPRTRSDECRISAMIDLRPFRALHYDPPRSATSPT